jgi:hypothetical protein
MTEMLEVPFSLRVVDSSTEGNENDVVWCNSDYCSCQAECGATNMTIFEVSFTVVTEVVSILIAHS